MEALRKPLRGKVGRGKLGDMTPDEIKTVTDNHALDPGRAHETALNVYYKRAAEPAPPPKVTPPEGTLYVFGRVCRQIASNVKCHPAYDYGGWVHVMRRHGPNGEPCPDDAPDAWGAWLFSKEDRPSPKVRRAVLAFGKGRSPEDAIRNMQTDMYNQAAALIPAGYQT